ncbi:unnamed protein product, partial [Scytosiphon promiscuus]
FFGSCIYCNLRRVILRCVDIISVTRSNLSLRNACRFVVQVGAGAEHMHTHGISHGDIKPQNILMFRGSNGSLVPQLADFGTARGESLPLL